MYKYKFIIFSQNSKQNSRIYFKIQASLIGSLPKHSFSPSRTSIFAQQVNPMFNKENFQESPEGIIQLKIYSRPDQLNMSEQEQISSNKKNKQFSSDQDYKNLYLELKQKFEDQQIEIQNINQQNILNFQILESKVNKLQLQFDQIQNNKQSIQESSKLQLQSKEQDYTKQIQVDDKMIETNKLSEEQDDIGDIIKDVLNKYKQEKFKSIGERILNLIIDKQPLKNEDLMVESNTNTNGDSLQNSIYQSEYQNQYDFSNKLGTIVYANKNSQQLNNVQIQSPVKFADPMNLFDSMKSMVSLQNNQQYQSNETLLFTFLNVIKFQDPKQVELAIPWIRVLLEEKKPLDYQLLVQLDESLKDLKSLCWEQFSKENQKQIESIKDLVQSKL